MIYFFKKIHKKINETSRKKEGNKKQRKEENKSNFKAFDRNGDNEESLPRFF